MEEGDSDRLQGVVKEFDDEKREGKIIPDDDHSTELYVQSSHIRDWYSLAAGESVEFVIKADKDCKSGYRAVDVTGPNKEMVVGSPGSRGAYHSGVGRGGSGSNKCSSCGETGHMASDCHLGWRAGGGGGSKECLTCGETGHMASDCPLGWRAGGGGGGSHGGQGGSSGRVGCQGGGGGGGGSNAGRGGRRGGGSGCFNCGEEGHFARECPHPSD